MNSTFYSLQISYIFLLKLFDVRKVLIDKSQVLNSKIQNSFSGKMKIVIDRLLSVFEV